MTYNISSDKLNNPLLKELLMELTSFFDSMKIDFYVIGATARDMILCNLYDLIPNRKTVDLDIAIAILDWSQFERIEKQLPAKEGFMKNKNQKQRFLYRNIYEVDIVPFGGVTQSDGNIYWPPNEDVAMSTWGFSEVAKATLTMQIDNEFTVQIASLPGIFLLKLIAWKDRHLLGAKDAYDIALMLDNYLDINIERVVDEHYDLYEAEDFDPVIAGSRLMARDVKKLLQEDDTVLNYLRKIVVEEINQMEGSRLINQLIESNANLNYDQVLSCLVHIINEWE
jgi:predicted nucleotidyltransferase